MGEADADGRRAISQASAQVDTLLRRNPHAQGESRPEERRIMFIEPLAVTFRVVDEDMTVWVMEMRLIRRREA